MEKWITKEDWNGNCPICGHEDHTHISMDYEIYDDGWVDERFACDKCGQEFTANYSLTFDAINYDSPQTN